MAIQAPTGEGTQQNIRSLNTLPAQRSYHYTKHFEPIYIYNVGRWAGEDRPFWVRNSGTGHTFVVPLCPREGDKVDGKEIAEKLRAMDNTITDEQITAVVRGMKAGDFSMPCLVPDPVVEFYPVRLGSPPKAETWEGKRIAQEVVNMVPGDDGVGTGKDPHSDLRFWGLFIAKGKVPTKDELVEADAWYVKRLDQLVTEANELYRDNRAKDIRKIHRFAAEERGISVPWNKNIQELAEPEKATCEFCRNTIIAGAKKCQHCGEWLDGRNIAKK